MATGRAQWGPPGFGNSSGPSHQRSPSVGASTREGGGKVLECFFVDGLPTPYSDPSSPAFDGHLSTTCESVGDGEERVA